MFNIAGNIRLILIGGVLLLVSAAISYHFYSIHQIKKRVIAEIQLKQEVQNLQKIIEQQEIDSDLQEKALENVAQQYKNARANTKALEQRFKKIEDGVATRDIGTTAVSKSQKIENVINKASYKAMRCFEIASGSEHTEEELTVTKKSQLNAECPKLANPNYIQEQP